ncbi:DUF5004 domain-containing protein [Flavobacteriaceae bacterium F89]|uniref:DUF5004 domain-containing protein n=1 Tax=Cerina litoralis TaxID=2874477 RepID=A0AAE3JM48_9FLAO|nr:DUF5004 domain-containing protein [Cerina litoralis]MCG2459405.1 DUF5004 domain-containing protein [Cerina litoralis]
MNLRLIFMGLALTTGLLFSGCSDDDDNCVQDYSGTLTASETLLVGEWNLTAMTSSKAVDLTDDDVENPSTDIYAQYTDCQKDAGYIFSEDRGYTFNQGTKVANCENKSVTNGTWQYTGNQINFVATCTVLSLPITFTNANNSFQSISQKLLIQDVSGQVVEADVTFVYTKATAG